MSITIVVPPILTLLLLGCQPSPSTNQEPYSAVGDILCYCPVVTFGPESFLAADVTEGLYCHCPDTLDLNDQEDHEFNLESYVNLTYCVDFPRVVVFI